jgi:hypothetical protein
MSRLLNGKKEFLLDLHTTGELLKAELYTENSFGP